MRDPKRIPVILARLQRVWETRPDWRLSQLLANAADGDPFYVEDERLLDKAEKLVEGEKERT